MTLCDTALHILDVWLNYAQEIFLVGKQRSAKLYENRIFHGKVARYQSI